MTDEDLAEDIRNLEAFERDLEDLVERSRRSGVKFEIAVVGLASVAAFLVRAGLSVGISETDMLTMISAGQRRGEAKVDAAKRRMT